MARRPFEQRAKTVNFDIDSLVNDDAVKSGFLCLSESTWELAYNLVLEYGHWRSRYFKTNSMTGELETITDDEYENTVLPAYYLAVEELNMSGCTDLVASVDNLAAQIGLINVALQGQGGCGCDGGEFDPAPQGNEDVTDPFDEDFLSAKCETANIIVDKVLYACREIDAANIDVWLLGGIGSATAIIGALLLAGPVGWTTILAVGVVSGLLLLLVEFGADDLQDVVTVIGSHQEDLVCALYEAADTASAKTAFLDVLDGQGITAIGQQMVGYMLFNDVLNQLFVPRGTYPGQIYDYLNDDYNPTDCSACSSFSTLEWTYDANVEGWVHSSVSPVDATVTGSWDASGALKSNLVIGTNPSGQGISRWRLDNLFIAASTAQLTVTHNAPSDAGNTRVSAIIRYLKPSDATIYSEQVDVETNSSGEVTANISGVAEIESVRLEVARSNGGGGGPHDFFVLADKVTLLYS